MRLTVAGTGLVAPPHDDAAVLQSAVVVVSPVAFEDQRRHGQCLDQVNITKRARSANVKIAVTSAGGKLLTPASGFRGQQLRRCVAYGLRLASANFLQRQLAQNVGMALAVSGKINDFGCDCLPDIVTTIADVQSDADRFEREAHHADCLVVELFAVEEGPDRHGAPTADRLSQGAQPLRSTPDSSSQERAPEGPGLRTSLRKMTPKPSGVGSSPDLAARNF